MRKLLIYIFIFAGLMFVNAQQLVLKKGIVIDSIKINDTINESYSLFIPTKFDQNSKWPIVFVFDVYGKGRKTLQMLKQNAEQQGYILAVSNNISDSISLSKNVLVTSRMMNNVISILPIHPQRIYASGFGYGAKYASILPILIRKVNGVLSFGESISNSDVLSSNNPFHYIGVSNIENYNLQEMKLTKKKLDQLRFPNQLYVYEDRSLNFFQVTNLALESFTLSAMSKNIINKDSVYINDSYVADLNLIEELKKQNKLLQAVNLMAITYEKYRTLKDVKDLKKASKNLKKEKQYKSLKRVETSVFFKEALLREDYDYAIYEDISTYNFNNLGWWKYQTVEIEKFISNNDYQISNMGKRLKAFVTYLVKSNEEVLIKEDVLDEEGLLFLWMLKTITKPNDYDTYKNIISYTSKTEDYGTALFYLEELLKAGYKNEESLYTIENTALLKITPEYNELITKYLNSARYEVME
jgi:hypothetical protein